MSAALRLLSECSAAGVELYLDNGRLRYRARVGIYTEALRQKVAAHKSELIALIQARIDETAHSNPAESSSGLQHSVVQQRGVHQVSVASGHAGQGNVADAAEAPQAGAAAPPTSGRAADVSTPEAPIPWHDATPDERVEIRAALFEGLPVRIYSKVLGEIVWWALDDDVARKLKGGEFVREGYSPYRGEAIYVWSELLAVLGFPPDALKNLHEFKKAFDARISKPRVICSGCRHLAASHHHCVMRKDIRIANPDRSIECGEYVPVGRRAW